MLAISLPGGIRRPEGIERVASMRALTGRLEQRICEQLEQSRTPARVSEVLARVVTRVGALRMNDELARTLSVADRQVLMLAVGAELSGDQVWLNPSCTSCDSRFDVGYRRSRVPTTAAGASYPFVEQTLSVGTFRLRVPTGADQEALAKEPEGESAEAFLLRRCVVEVREHGRAVPIDSALAALSPEDCACLESALDAVAPAVATTITTHCAVCGARQEVPFDPYDVWSGDRLGGPARLDEEVHRMASFYHWSEREILALPRKRRLRYLALIDRQRGLSA